MKVCDCRHGHYFALIRKFILGQIWRPSKLGGGGGGGGAEKQVFNLLWPNSVCHILTYPIHANGHMTSSSCHAAIP